MLQGLSLRRSAIAYLYRENPALKRDEYLRFYDRVTASGVEVGDFSIQGPELVMLRRPGPDRDRLEIRVGSWGAGPQLRLLVASVVQSTPVQMTRETADLAWEAFQSVWGENLSHPALVEVTLQLDAPAPGGASRDFLRDNVAHVGSTALHQLGREFDGFGLRLMSAVAVHHGEGEGPKLKGAGVRVRVESLAEDPSKVFIEVQAKWPTLSVPKRDLPVEVQRTLDSAVLEVNPEVKEPASYLTAVYDYVAENVSAFLMQA